MRKLVLLAFTLNLVSALVLPAMAQPGPSFGGDDEGAPPSRPSKYSSAADDDYLGTPPPRRNAPSQTAPSRLSQPVNSAKIIVPAFVTYWTHDGLGYHPSISLNVQNDTGQSLVGQTVQMQAHFMLLSEGISTISRWQTSFDLIGGIQQVNTEAHGKRPFELPIDPNDWPLIECKVLCKIGDNPGQTILITRIQAVAMNDDEARSALNNQLSRYRLNKYKVDTQRKKDALAAKTDPKPAPLTATANPLKTVKPPVKVEAPPQPEKPLTAVAASFSNPIASGAANTSPPREMAGASAVEAFIGKSTSQPGLSDDFYLFEKLYGLPAQTDVKDKNWVWAEYRKPPGTRVLAGSKGRTGKADTVIAVIKQDNLTDTQTVNCIKAIAGKFKSEKLSPLEHSVRYVDTSISATGRLELTQLSGQSFRGLSFKIREADGSHSTAVAVSRLPGALFEQIRQEGHTTDLLNFLLPSLGEQDMRQSQSRATSKDGDDDY